MVLAMMASLIMPWGSRGALCFSALTIAWAIGNGGAVGRLLRRHWFFFLFPGLALLSRFWSVAGSESLKHGAEYSLTILAGLSLTSRRDARSTIFAMFCAFGLYAMASFAWGTDIGGGFAGLNGSKNLECSIITCGAMISLLWLSLGIKDRDIGQVLLAALVLMLETYIAILSRSAGFTAAFVFGVIIFAVLVVAGRAGRSRRMLFVGLAAVAMVAGAVIFFLFKDQAMDLILAALQKDSTVTGRTYIWARARDLIALRPVLGMGFSAFWQQGNLDAEGLWQFAHLPDRTGFNFHNTGYEVLVSLGWTGAILFALTLGWGFARLIVAYVRAPTLATCFWIAMGAHMVINMPFETIGTYEFNYETVLLFAGFGYFRSRRESMRGARPAYAVQPALRIATATAPAAAPDLAAVAPPGARAA